jgi:hypothetical protein
MMKPNRANNTFICVTSNGILYLTFGNRSALGEGQP